MGAMKKTFKIKSNLKEISPVVKDIVSCLKKADFDNGILHDIKLATYEALINAIKHGNKFKEELPVIVNLTYSKDTIKISVQDKGKGYDHAKIPDPTLDEYIARGHGRGVFLIKRLMDVVHFNKSGNRIEMVKYIK